METVGPPHQPGFLPDTEQYTLTSHLSTEKFSLDRPFKRDKIGGMLEGILIFVYITGFLLSADLMRKRDHSKVTSDTPRN